MGSKVMVVVVVVVVTKAVETVVAIIKVETGTDITPETVVVDEVEAVNRTIEVAEVGILTPTRAATTLVVLVVIKVSYNKFVNCL